MPSAVSANGGGCRVDFGCSDGVRRAAVCDGTECTCLATDAVVARFPMAGFCALASAPQVEAVASQCVSAWTAALGGAAPDAGIADGGEDGGALGDAATAHDAGGEPDVPVERFNEHGSSSSPTSCAAVCMAAGARCAACPGQTTNGFATYTRRDAMGSQSQSRAIMGCADAVPARLDASFGAPYPLDDYYCCCAGPPATIVDDDIRNPRACDAVCSARGLQCSETVHWFSGSGGSEVSHADDATIRSTVESCTFVPPLTRTVNGRVYALSAHRCGCR